MLIMTLAHARTYGDGSLIAHLLKRWAVYLINNTLYPTVDQGSADFDSAADNTNLALKGIIGVRAMAEMSSAMREAEDVEFFNMQATKLIGQWTSFALSPEEDHILLDYGDDSSWALVYNLYADRLLGLNLVDSSIYEKQTSYYNTLFSSTYGLGIDSDHLNTGNSAWLLFAAATATDSVLRDSLVSMAQNHASFNGTPGVFSTIYDTSQGTALGGTASPGQGAIAMVRAVGSQRAQYNNRCPVE
ncbi:hypothetical protein OBBRIDRAFT_525583 [Obba rivulosa]|uniref:Glutaminase A central domain-containing protein n=1 Tax=Obba rivulosa TaxID=1052685 RepID=A0A8E2B043_9APHY|nr:hypothetical protein OBBRIDRAFT_525583 [Obba rivulosa]